VVNNKDNRVLLSRNYQSDNCPLEIKTSIFALEASLPGQIYGITYSLSSFCIRHSQLSKLGFVIS